MEFGITWKSVLKARLSPGSQVGQISAITAVTLSYIGSLWKLRDFQMLLVIINIPCLPFTYSKPWKWPQVPHGTQDKHPHNSGSDLPWYGSAACNPHEHELSQPHSLLCAFSSAQAQPDSVPHVGQRVQGCCSDLCSLQLVSWERIWCICREVCSSWHVCARQWQQKQEWLKHMAQHLLSWLTQLQLHHSTAWENEGWYGCVLPLLCLLAPRGKVAGKRSALKAASAVPGMGSSRLSDPWWPGTAASRRVNTERINSLAKGPVSVGLPSKTSQPEGLYSALTPDATEQEE